MAPAGEPQGIDEVDDQLVRWAREVLGEVEVALVPPGAPKGRGVVLQLFALGSVPPPRGSKRTPHQVLLRYLVTAWGEAPREAHRLLSDLLFAALERADVEVELAAPARDAAGGLPPPGFVLQVPLRRERPEQRAPLVRGPLQIETAPAAPLFGVVVGPGEQPVAGALVELPSLDLTSRTDPRGRFHFAAVPGGPRPWLLRVRAKGDVQSFTAPGSGEPLTIHFEIKEG